MEKQKTPVIYIGSRGIGGRNPVFIIAEIGTSHGGNIEKAFSLIDAAADSGADCVKFQHVIAAEIIHPLTGFVSLPGGDIPLFQRFRELEVTIEFLARCKNRAEGKGLEFLCTPFGTGSARQLKSLSPRAFKIASPELNHYPLLEEVASTGIPIILSTGVSLMEDIDRAVEITGKQSILLHCVTAYPAPEEEYNLKVISTLSGRFGFPVGVSDHTLDPLLVPALSAAAGGAVLEKHITLSNRDPGLDDPIALTPEKFAEMTKAVREARAAGIEQTITKLSAIHELQRIKKILGNGKKKLAPSESANYATTKRSIHALRPLSAGETFSTENTALLRTEKNLNTGLYPEQWPTILGKKASRDIPDGRGITWDDVAS